MGAEATWTRTFGASLFACALGVSGCAWILGGLGEAIDRPDAASAPSLGEAGWDGAPSCPGALPGYPYRRAFVLDGTDASVADYTVQIALPSDQLVAEGKVQPTGADYRFTDEEGRPLPFWVDGEADGGPRQALVRMHIQPGARGWVHYGNASAAIGAQRMDVFAPGIIDDPTFRRTDGWWVQFTEDPADRVPAEWSVGYEDEGVRFKVARSSGNNGASVVACQTVTFPGGSRYRVVFDTVFAREGEGAVWVWVSGLDRLSVWAHSVVEGNVTMNARDEETITFDSGTRVMCLGAGVTTGGSVNARFSRIRARRVVTNEPRASVGREETSCP